MDLGRRSIVEWAESAPEESAAAFVPSQDKFVVENSIGRGGMGEVFLVSDKDLRRQVAMKVLRPDMGLGREPRLHFVAEAQATSQLEHPGIPPVHDIGVTGDGRPYFTMKLVRGRTLAEVLRDLVLKRREVQREYTLHRLVTILERIAETLHFSHERGVIHRDLKPENIMLGDYGEVHLVDWGLARVRGDSAEYGRVETARTEAGLETQYGEVKGTLLYMSPEQARGETETLDGRTDIYALGCVLYEVLTLHPAFDPHDKELFAKVQAGDCPDIERRDPRRHVPPALARIGRAAMAKGREDRYESARELADALRTWLDGTSEKERRREEARKLVKKGQNSAKEYELFKGFLAEAEATVEAETAKYEGWQPVAEKQSLLEARKHAEALRIRAASAFAATTHSFNAALAVEEENAVALQALATLWKGRLIEAEQSGDEEEAAHARAMTTRCSSGLSVLLASGGPQIYFGEHPPVSKEFEDLSAYAENLRAFLRGNGSLTLVSHPPGAEARLYRYDESEEGVLVAEGEQVLGQTPLGPVDLKMGSYLCILRKEGFRDTRYPVHITRGRQWKGEVKLRTDEEIGERFVYVPGGPFIYGEGRATRTVELPDFAIAKYPVTFREYGEFLDTLDDQEARERCAHTENETYVEQGETGGWQPKADLLDDDIRALYRKRYGEGFELRLPVYGVSWDDAVAYCRWKTKTTGQEWRLPTEQEREKAARGVDGRTFAWGDLADASLGKCRDSRPENSQPEPVGAFPTAASVYGMGDASGGLMDWTDSWFDDRRSLRVLRGGSWIDSVALLRCSDRYAVGPRHRLSAVGFRCARSL
ncbi:MAG: bifunctional serine/threonine-protein kinase/formylglycine-generating enzyme family protein [Planctomycetota bacterium]|jgi:serine/threonine-protein kinase